MSVNTEIREMLPDDAIVLDNASFDNSIIGVTLDGRAIYSYERMIEEYKEDENCTTDEAVEWIDYNTMRAIGYMGEKQPMVVYQEGY